MDEYKKKWLLSRWDGVDFNLAFQLSEKKERIEGFSKTISASMSISETDRQMGPGWWERQPTKTDAEIVGELTEVVGLIREVIVLEMSRKEDTTKYEESLSYYTGLLDLATKEVS